MHKTPYLAVVLALALTLGNVSAAQIAPFVPQIVAKGKALNQTATIPTTTIYTPKQTGLFSLSVYGTIVAADSSSQSEWQYNLQWTDDSGTVNSATPLYGTDNTAGSFSNFIWKWGDAMPIEVKAGTPITFTVSQSGPADKSAYSLYYVLERLE
jgi:hypothetical protein